MTQANTETGMSTTSTLFTSLAVIVSVVAVAVAAIWFGGYADDVGEWWAKRYYKAKAIAEVKILENAGSEQVEGALKSLCRPPPFRVDCFLFRGGPAPVSRVLD